MSKPSATAILFVKDLFSLAQFYERIGALQRIRTAEDHVVFEIGTFHFIIHKIPEHIARDIAVDFPPSVREEGPIKLSFRVNSIPEVRELAFQLGGKLYGMEAEWEWDGNLVCDGYDPAGNVFQVYQTKEQ